jgi:type 1 glutamine amidotransferase
MPQRTPLEMVMWAAWLGVDPERVPEALKGHTCQDTMARWKRVGEAAVAYAAENAQ